VADEGGKPPGLALIVRRSLLTFVGLAGGCAALTVLFLCMRSVMDIGGSCAEGGPYVVARPCPKGIPGLLLGSIFGGIVLLGVYAVNTFRLNLVLWAWPALFISLGWNFLEYGFDPPEGGIVWSWLFCGVLFVVMGGGPVLAAIPSLRRRRRPSGGAPPPRKPSPMQRRVDGVVERLERLTRLHKSGQLADEEFAAAKAAVLDPGEDQEEKEGGR
jgi:hypothetical protein